MVPFAVVFLGAKEGKKTNGSAMLCRKKEEMKFSFMFYFDVALQGT